VATKKGKSTQAFVPIEEVRDGIVILKSGGMRAVLLASSLNFALKSPDEQQSIVLQFQNFLNSLDFPVQFHIQSRKLDIRPYVALLEERYKEQTNDLMKIQTREYVNFIKAFTENANIMTKNFFAVIPYDPPIIRTGSGMLSKVLNRGKGAKSASEKAGESFDENRSQLEQRMSVVEQGLIRSGVRTLRLGTEELVELYFKIFNPGESEKPMVNN